MDSLFTEKDFDQEMLSKERKKKEEKTVKAEDGRKEESKSYDKNLYVIDGYGLIYRSYFAFLSHPLLDKSGMNVSAYSGFFNTLLMLLNHYDIDYLAVAMDEKGPTFRHKMFPQYKANREKAPEDLHAQVPLIRKTLEKMNIKVLSAPGYEADDLIASLSRVATEKGIRTIMFTGDKDLLQLVSPSVWALRPSKKEKNSYEMYTADEVRSSYGVRPDQIVDYLALTGDSADNIPGVKGIGDKSAVKLLEEYESLDGIYRNTERLKGAVKTKMENGKEDAYLSRKLVRLSSDALSDEFDLSSLSTSLIVKENAAEDFLSHQLSTLAKKLGTQVSAEIKEEKGPVFDERYSGKGSYRLLSSLNEVEQHLDQCISSCSGILAFDTETTGLDADDRMIGFSFSYKAKEAFYVPLSLIGEDGAKKIFDKYFASGKLYITAHNAKFDLKAVRKLKSNIKNIIFDSFLAFWLLESNRASFSLDAASLAYLGYETVKYEDIVEKGKNLESVDLSAVTEYAAEDADIALRLYYVLKEKLIKENLYTTLMEMEIPLMHVLASMEERGILIDEDYVSHLSILAGRRLDELVKDIYLIAGHEFNINSTRQLGTVLFDEMKLATGKKTQSGYSTDVETLEMLRRTTDNKIIKDLLEYRQLAKLKSTYIDTLPSCIAHDGRIHTSFLQSGTATGRLSSRNPNLQNIPVRTEEGRQIRNCFIPRPGYVFISADYSQVELVMLAHMSQDPGLMHAFVTGEDVHRYTASLIFSKTTDAVTADERRTAKTINFGIMYGMSAFRLANDLGIKKSEADEFMTRYFERYPKIKSFMADLIKKAEKDGYVRTLFNHKRFISGINSVNKTEKNASSRVAVNTVIQGSASEIIKRAMIALPEDVRCYLLLQVHDELIFECPENEKEEVMKKIRDTMENTTKLTVPLKVSLECASRWGDMH